MTKIARRQGSGDQWRRARAGHHAGAPMRARGRRPGAGGPHRRAPGRRRQADHRRGRSRGDGAHRHHRRRSGQQPRRRHPGGVRQGRRAGQQRVPGAVDETVRGHHISAHPRRDRTQRAGRAAADPGVHAGAGRVEGLGRQRQLHGDAALPGEVRRLQDGQVRAAGDVAVAGHRTGRAGHSRQFRCARLHLGRDAAGLLQPPGRQVRHHRRPDLRGHRGELRPQAAAHRRRGGLGDPVHGQRPVQRHHRPDPGRQLRGVHTSAPEMRRERRCS